MTPENNSQTDGIDPARTVVVRCPDPSALVFRGPLGEVLPNPWLSLRDRHPDVRIRYAPLPERIWGYCDPIRRTIWIDERLTVNQARCTLEHERQHLLANHIGTQSAEVEQAVGELTWRALAPESSILAAMAATADRRELAKLLHLDVPTVDLLLAARDKLPGRPAEPTEAKLPACPDWCDGHTPDEAAKFTAGAAQFHDKVLWEGGKHGVVSIAQYAPEASEDDGTEKLPYVNFWVADVAGLGYDDTKAMIDALKVAQGLVDGLRALDGQGTRTTIEPARFLGLPAGEITWQPCPSWCNGDHYRLFTIRGVGPV